MTDIDAQLAQINGRMDGIVTALSDLQAADTSLQAKVSQVLADFAAALTAAQGDPAAIEQVVTDMNNMAAQLTAADPTPPAPPATPPAGG